MCTLLARSLLFRQRRLSRRAAGFKELRVFLLAVFREPIDVEELREGAFGGSLVEAQRDEAALFVERVAETERASLQMYPAEAEGVGRQAEGEGAGLFQPFLYLRGGIVAGVELPFV